MIITRLGTFINNVLQYTNSAANGEDIEIIINKDKKLILTLSDDED